MTISADSTTICIQAAMDYLKEMERKNMENQKLYLSITLDSDTNNYEIKLHTSACFNEWIAKGTVRRIRIYNPECFKTIQMCNIENMVNKIYEFLEKTSNMIYYLMGETPNMQSKSISLNTAYVITIDYFNHEEYRTMWDVTDLCNPEKIEGIEYDCGCCCTCEDDEDEDDADYDFEDEELVKVKMTSWHINHIYDSLCEIKQQIKELTDNKDSDSLKCQIDHLSIDNECIRKHLELHDHELFPKEELPLYTQVTDLQDAKNKIQFILDNHEKRITDVENENMMLKSIMLHYFNNDKSPHSGDRK